MTAAAPHLDVDPFDDAFLTDPYPFHERIREAGPVVFLDPLPNLRLRPPRRGHGRTCELGDLLLRRRGRARRFPPLQAVATAEPHP